MNEAKMVEIKDLLNDFENKYNVTVLHAVVVGSRQFRLEHKSSDWDVRFVYKDSPDWYFKSNNRSYTHEGKYGDVDWHGLNLARAIEFTIKSNGLFFEWMNSDIIIKSDEEWFGQFKDYIIQFRNPRRIYAFYFAIASEAREYIKKNGFSHKHFFIIVRALLSLSYINSLTLKPNSMEALVIQSAFSLRVKELVIRLIGGYKNNTITTITKNELNCLIDTVDSLFNQKKEEGLESIVSLYVDPKKIDTFHMNTILK